ncbi:MAG: DNA primase [Alphaproteobacteria bacterium]|nr:DNA primase [Alphaproteobacteria bacterium]
MDKEFINRLKSTVSIVDVISSRVRLRKMGHDWFGLCPFHKEKTGSFKVDESKGFYHCFGCGAGGDVIKFIEEYDHVDFREAVEIIANMSGIQIPKDDSAKVPVNPYQHLFDILNIANKYFVDSLASSDGQAAREYLQLRQINKEYCEKFSLGYCPDNSELYFLLKRKGFSDEDLIQSGVFVKPSYGKTLINRYHDRLMFPIFDEFSKCVGFGGRILDASEKAKYINSPETVFYTKSDHLYGYHLAKKSKTRQIILTEGYLDVIAMHQAGFDGTVASLGTTISESQINKCWKVCNYPVVALDGDQAGIKASYRWVDKILACLVPGKSFKFAQLPQNADLDLLVYNKQISVIKDSIEHAMSLSDWLWSGAFSLFPAETPEQKAEITKMIEEKISTIKDASVKKFYMQEFYRTLKYPHIKTSKFKRHENLCQPISANEKIEKIFVATILNHPYILDEVAEDFVKLEFTSTKMNKLKSMILQSYQKYAESDSEQLKDAMEQYKKEFREDLQNVELHANFVGTSIPDEKAKEGWMNLAKKYVFTPLLNEDLQKAENNLQFSLSESDWQKLKMLKKEIILNKRKDGSYK